MRTLIDQETRSQSLMTQITEIQARGDREDRDLTGDEATQQAALLAEYDDVQADIARRRRIEQGRNWLNAPAGSEPQPQQLQPVASGAPAYRNGVTPNNGNGRPAQQPYRVQVESRAAGTHGFRSIGEFAQAVRNSSLAGRTTDPRLLNAGPIDNVMTEGIGPDGGYAVPPDFRATIVSLINAEDSLLSRTDLIETSSNTVTLPIDATSPWQTTGGIQAYWEGEAQQKISSKTPLDQVSVKLNKLYVLIAVSDELLEDAPALTTLLTRKAPEKMDFEVSNAILNGTGAGQPLGIYKSPGAVVVPRDAGQPAGTVTASNVLKMWGAMLASSRGRAVWVTNQDIETGFATMFIPIVDPSGKVVNGQVTYLPPGGISGNPYSTLMGRPIIITEAAPDAGMKGDLALIDFQSYLTAEKVGGGLKQDISIHLLFDWDVTCLRFVLRVGGTPYFKAPVPSRSGRSLRSPYVLLGADAGGTTVTGRAIANTPEGEQIDTHEQHRQHPLVEGTAKSDVAAEQALAESRKRRGV